MSNKGAIYSRKVIAELLGRSEKRIKQLTEEGVLEEYSQGYYRLAPTIKAFVKYLDGFISDDDQASNYNTEKAKLTKVKREDAELNLKRKRNELHKSVDVEFIMTNMLIAFKSKLEVLPHKVLPSIVNLPDGKDKAEKIVEVLKGAVDEALNELSGYDPEYFDEDKYLSGLDDTISDEVN